MIMVAVLDLYVDAGFSHLPCNFSELSGLCLIEPLHEYVPDRNHTDTRRLECRASCLSIRNQEVSYTFTFHHPHTAALHTYSCPAKASPISASAPGRSSNSMVRSFICLPKQSVAELLNASLDECYVRSPFWNQSELLPALH